MTVDDWREWARNMLDLNVARDDEWMRDKLTDLLVAGAQNDAMLCALEKRQHRDRRAICYPPPPPPACPCCDGSGEKHV